MRGLDPRIHRSSQRIFEDGWPGQARHDESFRPAPHPLLRLLVFCTRLPCSPCSRVLCFSSSRWPLVVSRGIFGSLPGPLWLLLSSGTGGMVLVMRGLLWLAGQRGARRARSGRASPFINIKFFKLRWIVIPAPRTSLILLASCPVRGAS